MTQILNQNTEIETPLDNVTEKRKTKQSTPETTVDYLGNINPSIGGYVGNLYDQTADPSMGNLSRQDIYPTLPEPTIRQGIQGQFVKMPTVVTPAGLIPYELIYEQERQREQQEQQRLLKREQDNFYNLSIPEINQSEANIGFAKAKVNWFKEKTASLKEIYGDNYIKAFKEDKEAQLVNKLMDDNAKQFNTTYALAQGFVNQSAKNSPYRSAEAIKAAEDFIAYSDKYMGSKTLDELESAAKKMAETTTKLKQYANVQMIVEDHAKVLRENTDKFGTQLEAVKNASTYDEKVMAFDKIEGNFFTKEVDKDGNEKYVFNEDWAKDDWAKTYESQVPGGKLIKKDDGTYELADENMKRFAPDPNSFIQQGLNVTRSLIEPEIKQFSTGYNAAKRLEFDKKQFYAVDAVQNTAPKGTPVIISDSEGNTYEAVDHWSFGDKPLPFTGNLTKINKDGSVTPITGVQKAQVVSHNLVKLGNDYRYVAMVEYLEPITDPLTKTNMGYKKVTVPSTSQQVLETVNNKHLRDFNDAMFESVNSTTSIPKEDKVQSFTIEQKPNPKGNQSSGTTKKVYSGLDANGNIIWK